jgi:hypothetical protein
MAGLDRREFLLAAAGTAGASVAGGAGALTAPVSAAVDTRAATYRALVRSLRRAPDGRFRHADPAAAQRRYQRWYAAQPEAVQGHADAILDALKAHGRPGYAELAVPPSGPLRGRRPATMAAAIGLACVGCEPAPGEDERPDLPMLAPA